VWRRTLFSLHRDIGFLCLGLTVAYGLSGIAVNHREDWDYNTVADRRTQRIGTPAEILAGRDLSLSATELARNRREELVTAVLAAVGRNERPTSVFWRGADRLSLFFGPGERDVLDYSPATGMAEHTLRRDRPLFRQVNFLHLNEPRGAWTFVADGYAAALLFLAVSGALIVRGRKGWRGRGGVLAAIGFAVPVITLWLWR
jgi:hypothetical protein